MRIKLTESQYQKLKLLRESEDDQMLDAFIEYKKFCSVIKTHLNEYFSFVKGFTLKEMLDPANTNNLKTFYKEIEFTRTKLVETKNMVIDVARKVYTDEEKLNKFKESLGDVEYYAKGKLEALDHLMQKVAMFVGTDQNHISAYINPWFNDINKN